MFGPEPHTRENHPTGGYIAVDFDGTLATYTGWSTQGPNLGTPIPAMVERVKRWLAAGEDVRIFTARASASNPRLETDTAAIKEWCSVHLGRELPITNAKEFTCKEIWDDVSVSVEPGSGWRTTSTKGSDPLSPEEELALTDFAINTTSPRPDSKTVDDIFVIPEGWPNKYTNALKWSHMAKLAEKRGESKGPDENYFDPSEDD